MLIFQGNVKSVRHVARAELLRSGPCAAERIHLPACTWGFQQDPHTVSHTHTHAPFGINSTVTRLLLEVVAPDCLRCFSPPFLGLELSLLERSSSHLVGHSAHVCVCVYVIKNVLTYLFVAFVPSAFVSLGSILRFSVKKKRKKHLSNLNLERYAAHCPASSSACILSAGLR